MKKNELMYLLICILENLRVSRKTDNSSAKRHGGGSYSLFASQKQASIGPTSPAIFISLGAMIPMKK